MLTVEPKFSAQNLLELVSYSKFGFSRPDLDGNKPAKGKYLARKARDKEMFISSVTKGRLFFLFEFNSMKVNP